MIKLKELKDFLNWIYIEELKKEIFGKDKYISYFTPTKQFKNSDKGDFIQDQTGIHGFIPIWYPEYLTKKYKIKKYIKIQDIELNYFKIK